MKNGNIEYYKFAVERAKSARASIVAAKEDYERKDNMWREDLAGGLLGEIGFSEKVESAKRELNEKIESAQAFVLGIADDYAEEMKELGRLDGNRVDDATMKLLNSGLNLTHADWQELANKHASNATMTRILRAKYDANRPPEKGDGSITVVQFGQSPADREKVFRSFVNTLANSVNSDFTPKYGGTEFSSRASYWNYLAKESLKSMRPFEGEDRNSIDVDFEVKFEESEEPGYQVF